MRGPGHPQVVLSRRRRGTGPGRSGTIPGSSRSRKCPFGNSSGCTEKARAGTSLSRRSFASAGSAPRCSRRLNGGMPSSSGIRPSGNRDMRRPRGRRRKRTTKPIGDGCRSRFTRPRRTSGIPPTGEVSNNDDLSVAWKNDGRSERQGFVHGRGDDSRPRRMAFGMDARRPIRTTAASRLEPRRHLVTSMHHPPA